MSQAQRTEPKVYDDVSLDEFVLVSIMQYLQTATALALERDYEASLESCDYVWAILPNAVINKIPNSPLDTYKEKVKNEIPSFDILLKEFPQREREIVRLAYPIKEEDLSYYPDGNEIQVAVAKYRALWQADIARPIIRQFTRDVKMGLESTGLYINGIRRKIIPTADLKPDQPLPLLQKLTASQPR